MKVSTGLTFVPFGLEPPVVDAPEPLLSTVDALLVLAGVLELGRGCTVMIVGLVAVSSVKGSSGRTGLVLGAGMVDGRGLLGLYQSDQVDEAG